LLVVVVVVDFTLVVVVLVATGLQSLVQVAVVGHRLNQYFLLLKVLVTR
jgi:hypothetical protein